MRTQRGMTIIELMIAISLGIIISMFVSNIMISSARNASTSEGISQAQETGRLVMAWLSDYLDRAGYESNYLSGATVNFFPLAKLCASGGPTPPANGAHCSFDSDSNANGGDRIAIRRKAGGVSPSNIDLRTCTGITLSADIVNNQKEVVDVFWVQDEALHCISYDANGVRIGTSQSIANGVESIQFLVGLGNNKGTVERFVAPSAVSIWNKVVAIRVAILTKEFGSGSLEKDKRYYGLLNSQPILFEDTSSRSIEISTIWFPNTKKL